MDMSKLPRLSQSPAPPPDDDTAAAESLVSHAPPATADPGVAPAPPPGYPMNPASAAGEAWISIAIGAILLLMNPHIPQWLVSLISAYKPPFLPITDLTTGAEVPYPRSIFFFNDLCMFAFSLTLIIDGLILFTRRRALLAGALALTIAATLMNLFYVVKSSLDGSAFPLMSAVAVALGVYIALYQWKLLSVMRPVRRDNPPAPA
jgi:hypothetical protein